MSILTLLLVSLPLSTFTLSILTLAHKVLVSTLPTFPWPGYVWSSYSCIMLRCRTPDSAALETLRRLYLDNLYLYSKLTTTSVFLLLLYSRLPEVTHCNYSYISSRDKRRNHQYCQPRWPVFLRKSPFSATKGHGMIR